MKQWEKVFKIPMQRTTAFWLYDVDVCFPSTVPTQLKKSVRSLNLFDVSCQISLLGFGKWIDFNLSHI